MGATHSCSNTHPQPHVWIKKPGLWSTTALGCLSVAAWAPRLRVAAWCVVWCECECESLAFDKLNLYHLNHFFNNVYG